MKHMRLSAAALGLALLLAACAPGQGGEQGGESPREPSQAASQIPEREEQPEEEAPAPPRLEDVTGEYLLLEGGYYQSPPPELENEYLYLGSVTDLGALVLAWEVSNGRQGPTLLEARNTADGSILFQAELEGYSYLVEDTGELPENFRAIQEGRVVYLASGDMERREIYTVPAEIAAGFWSLPFGGAPYDYARGRDILAWSTDDGVYVAGGDGGGQRLVLANSGIQALLEQGIDPGLGGGREEYTIPDWGETAYRYSNPILLNSGRQVVATACAIPLEFPDNEPVMLFAAWADLETGETGHAALQFSPIAAAAAKLGGGSVSYGTYAGTCILELGLDGPEVSVIPHDEDYFMVERSLDYQTFYRIREEAGRPELYRYSRESPDDGEVLLATTRDYLSFWWLGGRYALCEAGNYDPAAADLVLVPLG